MNLLQYKNKIFSILLIAIIFSIGNFGYALGADPDPSRIVDERQNGANKIIKDSPIIPLANPLRSNINSVGALVNKFVELFSYLVIIAAVIMIVFTGFQLILARGNPEKMKEYGQRLGYILIGVGIVIGARIMIMIIINTLEATGTINQGTINTIQRAVDGK